MAKVQFNCRLDEEVAEWIATESALKTAETGRKFSQADVVSLLVNELQNERAVQVAAVLRPLSKKERIAADLAASDLTAQAAGRDNIEYGHHDATPKGQHVVSLDATAKPAGSNIGKASVETVKYTTKKPSWKREIRPKGDKTR